MTTLKPDGRNINDIIAEIKRKSEFYTPEWRYDPANPDGGGALARLFSEMTYDTIEKYNRFPEKCYLEFLNMLGAGAKSVSPAVGTARAQMVALAREKAFVKKGSQLFTDITVGDDDMRIIFETMSSFYATPAEIKCFFMTDPAKDIITKTALIDEDGDEVEGAFPTTLFMPRAEDNLERHCFGAAHSKALKINGAAQIRIKIENSTTTYLNEKITAKLCDSSFAEWSYVTESGKEKLAARQDAGCIILEKTARKPIALTDEFGGNIGEEETLPWIFCDMKLDSDTVEIAADSISVSTTSVDDEFRHGILPGSLYSNDSELNAEGGGYCFGSEPSVYDSFYVMCDEAFSKAGAQVTVELLVDTVSKKTAGADSPELEFNSRLVVDKDEAQAAPLDNIFISGVAWEYWNGSGWARLEVGGDVNPFSCDESSAECTLKFTCPEDFAPSLQNAHEGYWIRARVTDVENAYSLRAVRLLPLLKSIAVRFDYGSDFLPAEKVVTINNCSSSIYGAGEKALMMLYMRMPERSHAVYFCFDKPPEGFPVNFYFDFQGTARDECVTEFSRYSGDNGGTAVWSELKVTDKTGGLTRSGIISLYSPSDFTEAEIFGERGFWIRVVNKSMDYAPDSVSLPRLSGIVKNAVDIIQKESVTDERVFVPAGRPNQHFRLRGAPVISCELWVNELNETALSELEKLAQQDSTGVKPVYGADGQLEEFWVRWRRCPMIGSAAPDSRCYELDSVSGTVRFGDGHNGRIPAYEGADAQISVNYSFGGGTKGNLEANAIDGLLVDIPYIESITNFRPTCGGSDGRSLEEIKKIGAGRLLHLGRALSPENFENLVLEEFSEVKEVRCFNNMDADENRRDGCVCLVIMPQDYTDEVYSAALCARIYDFIGARADINLVAGGDLSVVPAKVMRVSSTTTVSITDFDSAAETEQAAVRAIEGLFGSARIGYMPDSTDILTVLGRIENIAYVKQVLLAGEYYSNGRKVTVPLEKGKYRYFVAAGGTHTIRM